MNCARAVLLHVGCRARIDGAFPHFARDGDNDAVAVAFSPDGYILYVATSGNVSALDSSGDYNWNWNEGVDDNDLSDITVSPDGLSVWTYSP